MIFTRRNRWKLALALIVFPNSYCHISQEFKYSLNLCLFRNKGCGKCVQLTATTKVNFCFLFVIVILTLYKKAADLKKILSCFGGLFQEEYGKQISQQK